MNKIAVTLIAAFLGGRSFATAAEPTEGVLEKGAAYSALCAVSRLGADRSGHSALLFIAYFFAVLDVRPLPGNGKASAHPC